MAMGHRVIWPGYMQRQAGLVNFLSAMMLLLITTLVTSYTMRQTRLSVSLSGNRSLDTKGRLAAMSALNVAASRLTDAAAVMPGTFAGALGHRLQFEVTFSRHESKRTLVIDLAATGRVLGAKPAPVLTRRLTQAAVFIPYLRDYPPVPLVSGGSVNIAREVRLENPSGVMAWAGRGITGAVLAGRRVRSFDPVLRDVSDKDWIQMVTGWDRSRLLQLSEKRPCIHCALKGETGMVVYLKAIQGRTLKAYGRPTKGGHQAYIIIVDGDIEITEPLDFSGIMIIHGTLLIDHPNVRIHGSIVVSGDVVFRSGSLSFDRQVIEHLRQTGQFALIYGSLSDVTN